MNTIFLVDDDPGVRTALARAMRAIGWTVHVFESAEEFLARTERDMRGCLVLDVGLPGIDGLALQRELARCGQRMPVVFLSGYGDIPTSVRAIRAGATDFLTKPVRLDELERAVRDAIADHEAQPPSNPELSAIRSRFAALTTREREVLDGIVKGKLNKQIAGDLGIVEQTVKFHRARIMGQMQAHTVFDLARMTVQLGL